MVQFLADNIDQMDFALDQLAMNDRNFDRFALMLIDNVVEITLHKHAQEIEYENNIWSRLKQPKYDAKVVQSALGQHFEPKINLGKVTGLLSSEIADSFKYLHSFRNTAYHRGLRHEGILHSLSLFYFKNACAVFENYSPMGLSWSSDDRIPYRALKYLGKVPFGMGKEAFSAAWKRLYDVAASMGDTLIFDLSTNLESIIESTDQDIHFLAGDSTGSNTRDQVVVSCQVWHLAFTEEGKSFAASRNGPKTSVQDYVEWLTLNYTWPINKDPIPSWRRRLKSLRDEKSAHMALKKYCDFMKQTESLRMRIEESARRLDAYIQHQIDVARGK